MNLRWIAKTSDKLGVGTPDNSLQDKGLANDTIPL
jgi:hypothetical protein